MPGWRKGQAVSEWREIPGSSITLAPPTNVAKQTNGVSAIVGPSSRLDAWCGLSVDTRNSTVWAVANGGHGDYFGNEVVKIDLMADAPKWIEWMAGSSGNVVDAVTPGADASHARYKDGRPCSTHSYYGQQFLERQNRALRLGGSTAPIGSAFENVEGFNTTLGLGADGWDPAGTFGFCLGGINGGWTPAIGWSACKDPLTEMMYVTSAPSVHKFTPASSGTGGVWSILGAMPPEVNSGTLAATAVDYRRNRMLWIKGQGPNRPYTCDLATGVWTARTHPDSAAKTQLDGLSATCGIVYVASLDAFFVRGGTAGDKVFVINASTFEVSLMAPVGGTGVPQSNAIGGENVFNRWLFVPALEGVVYFPKAVANAWFLRLY